MKYTAPAPKPNNDLDILFIIFLLIVAVSMLTGCKTKEKLTERTVDISSKEVVIKDTTIQGFELITLPGTIDTLRINDTITIKDTKSEALLQIWRNKYGELKAKCEQQDNKIKQISKKESSSRTKDVFKERIVTRAKYNWVTFLPWGIVCLGALGIFLKLKGIL